MTFLGIGPGELVLILLILLMVVGPDKLPGLARQGGTLLVRARNWVQRSPDAAMVLRARQEIEAELAQLRRSLAEVQIARDEVVDAARQVNTMVGDDVLNPVRQASNAANAPLVDSSGQVIPPADTPAPQGASAPQTVARSNVPGQVAPAPELPTTATPTAALEEHFSVPDELILPESARQEQALEALNAPEPLPSIDPRSNTDDDLRREVRELARELRELRAELTRRNLLDGTHTNGTHAPVAASVQEQ